jgi:hypothetical protein
MKTYACECCNYLTTLKSNYNRHVDSEVHKRQEHYKNEINQLEDENKRLKELTQLLKIDCLFEFMRYISEIYEDDNSNTKWINLLIEKQERLNIKLNNDILRKLLEEFTDNVGEINYEEQIYFIYSDLIFYIDEGLITITDDYEERLKIIIAEEMDNFDDFEIEYDTK